MAGTNEPTLKGALGSDPFRAGDIHAERLVWHPLIHEQLYNENCYYFLLRLRDPIELVSQLQRLVLQAQIISSCIYVIYGNYDVLVRLWATHEKRNRFVSVLSQRQTIIDEVQEFQAKQIDYVWVDDAHLPLEPSRLSAYKSKIDRLCRQVLNQAPMDNTVLDELINVGLVHRLPQSPKPSIKFYIALQRQAGLMEPRIESAFVRQVVRSPFNDINNISLYTGLGFATYLIKAVTHDYYTIYSWISHLQDQLSQLQLRPLTMVIANQDAPESDHVDVEWSEFGTSLLAISAALGPESNAAISKLDHAGRKDIAEFFEGFAYLLGTPFESLLLGMIYARILPSRRVMNQTLSALSLFENLLRQYLVDLWTRNFGRQSWFQRLQEFATECGLDPTKNPVTSYTLHDLEVMANYTGTLNERVARELADSLGDDWAVRIRAIVPIRNAVTHGKIFEVSRDDYFRDEWPSVANSVAQIGEMYNRLVKGLVEG